MPEGSTTVPMHPLVCQQVAHLLRVRVLQELYMIARRLLRRRRSAKPDEPPLLRRLTRAEWIEIRASGVVPYKNAVALLVVPPPNRDPKTKMRPSPAATSAPDADALSPLETPTGLPICVMYPLTGQEPQSGDHALPDSVSSARVPLYNGVPLFPSRTQRAALHAALGNVLRAERASRLTAESAPSGVQDNGSRSKGVRAKGDQKASHVILVCSDEESILRGDTVPLAIALWRLRMWEGDGAEDCFVDWIAEPIRTA
ncbi:hypothetical protein BC628DRAFT_329305 [Trametes gibbosa]|nr:hypothetical protein BC628DRAFT_329305 [Trametes gibbosa]